MPQMNLLPFFFVTKILMFLCLIALLYTPIESVIKFLTDPFRILCFKIWIHNFKKEPILSHDTQDFRDFMKLASLYCLEAKADEISSYSGGQENDEIIYVESTWQVSGMCLCVWKSTRDQEIRMGIRLLRLSDKYMFFDETFHQREWSDTKPVFSGFEARNFRHVSRIFDRACKDYGLQC